MGLFSRGNKTKKESEKKTTTDITFGITSPTFPRTVGTQNGEREVSSWDQVADCLEDMFDDDNQFVTLTLVEIRHNIRYVQACPNEKGIIVQLGIEEKGRTKLVEKICSETECVDIFRKFYESSHVQGVEDYKPVEFFV